jgi:hypothetical protein
MLEPRSILSMKRAMHSSMIFVNVSSSLIQTQSMKSCQGVSFAIGSSADG